MDTYSAFSLRPSVIAALVATIAGLLALSLALAGYTLRLRRHHRRRDERWRALGTRWEAPLLDALADPLQVSRIHDLIGPTERMLFVRFALEYARRVTGRERDALRDIVLPYLPPIAERAASRQREVRTRAVQTLGLLGLPTYAPTVVAALDDESPLVAMVAARSLCRREHPEYVPAVLGRLRRFEGWSRRYLAAMFAEVGAEVAPPLRETLGDATETTWARAVAADALRRLADFDAGDLAAAVVGGNDDRELVAAALHLLAVVGRPDHARVIRQRCSSDDFVIRSHAMAALGIIADEDDQVILLGGLADPSPWVAANAARGLRTSGLSLLLEDLASSDHPRALLARQVLMEVTPG